MFKYEPLKLDLQFFKYEPLKLNLQFFGEGEGDPLPTPPTFTLDDFKAFMDQNDEAKQLVQSQKDSFFSSSLDTWKKNNLDNLVNAKVKELYPEETPEQQRIREMELKIKNMERQEQLSAIKVDAVDYANTLGLPVKLVDRFLGDDLEATKKNIDDLAATFEPYIAKKVEERFKTNGFTPGKGGTTEPLTFAQKLAKEKQEEANKKNVGIDIWAQAQNQQQTTNKNPWNF